jgi:hypothetical protein
MDGHICSEGKYEGKPCYYEDDIYNCISSIEVTKEMVEQLNETGYLSVTYERK